MWLRAFASVLLACAVLLTGCAGTPSTTAPSGSGAVREPNPDPAGQLHDLVEAYFEELLQLNPLLATFIGDDRYNDKLPNSIGPEQRALAVATDQRYLAAARALDATRLTGGDLITHEIFVRELDRSVQGERFPDYLLPINQAGGLLTTMVTLGAGDNAQPFATVKDYKAWLSRLDGYVVWIDQAIVNMREGITRGVVQPRVVIEKVLPQLDAMITADPTQNVYFGPIAHIPDGISATDRDWLTAQYRAAIGDKLVPAFERLRAFVRDEYLPHGRETVAWTALPDGEAWYAFAAEGHTTVHMSADEIHQLGLSEVARILGEMDEVRRQVGFEGDRQAFFDYLKTDPQFYFTRGEDLVAGYVTLKLGRRPEGPDTPDYYVPVGRGATPPTHVDGYFGGPTDVAFDSDDNIYISDGYRNSRVAKFDRNGNWVMSWGSRGASGPQADQNPSQFNTLHNIGIDRQNNVYVADRNNRRIQVFRSRRQVSALHPSERGVRQEAPSSARESAGDATRSDAAVDDLHHQHSDAVSLHLRRGAGTDLQADAGRKNARLDR